MKLSCYVRNEPVTDSAASRDAEYFDRIYAKSEDPWRFRSSPYERRKYARTLAALPARRFRAALEVGCSIGELTKLLAPRCEALHGLDVAAAALETARQQCDAMMHVRFSQMKVPSQWPVGQYDLIVLSEVLYFLSAVDLRLLAGRVKHSLTEGGVVLLVNWLGVADNPHSGDAAATGFMVAGAPELRADLGQRYDEFRIDRLCRPRSDGLPDHPSA